MNAMQGINISEQNKIMKKLLLHMLFFSALISCKSDDINPSDLIGKWGFTGLVQSKNTDGTWSQWREYPFFCIWAGYDFKYEFTSDGNFLRDGQPGADCCDTGNKFRVVNNEINFSDFLPCPTVRCAKPQNWIIVQIKEDTLILEKYFIRNKYIKIK